MEFILDTKYLYVKIKYRFIVKDYEGVCNTQVDNYFLSERRSHWLQASLSSDNC